MSKKQTHFEGQLPLMGQVSNAQPTEEVGVVPMEFNSKVESSFFSQALLGAVPKDRQGDPRVKQSIDTLYSAYYSVVNATRSLAIAVYEFCELTGAKYDDVGIAFSKGIQKQLSKGYISKLYHAGKAMNMSPVAKRITDIESLASIGKLTPSEINSTLTEEAGQAKLGGQFVSLMTRDQFRSKLSEVHPDIFGETKAKAWNIKTFRESVDAAIKATSNDDDVEFSNHLIRLLGMVDVRIKKLEQIKLAEREAKKLAKSQSTQMQASA